MDIPLLNESLIYSKRINRAVKNYQLSVLGHKKLVNMIHKYDYSYYKSEKAVFLESPDEYMSSIRHEGEITKEFISKHIGKRLLVKTVLKALAHYLYRAVGKIQLKLLDKESVTIIRKSYVDDVEGLFDIEQDVVRFVYPFPLNLLRQYRYIRYLKANEVKYILSGLPYSPVDIYELLRERTYYRLQKMEHRAQLLHALQKEMFKNLKLVQCAEEYDIGSLAYCILLKRRGIEIVNCAHGVGKYLPYHYYSRFDVLTKAQQEYYGHFNASKHNLRLLKKNIQDIVTFNRQCVVTLLGQYSSNTSELILLDEKKILGVLNKIASGLTDVIFLYKKHPNCKKFDLQEYKNISLLENKLVGGDSKDVLQLSLFSTCQIDPNFIGKKVLIETEYIKPEIAYGKYEPIVKLDHLGKYVLGWIKSIGKE